MRKDRKEINFKRRDYESVLGRQASLGWNSKKVRKKTSTVYRVNTSILILQLYWRLIPQTLFVSNMWHQNSDIRKGSSKKFPWAHENSIIIVLISKMDKKSVNSSKGYFICESILIFLNETTWMQCIMKALLRSRPALLPRRCLKNVHFFAN